MVAGNVVVDIGGLSILVFVEGVLGSVNIEHRIVVPPDLLGGGHGVGVLVLGHGGQYLQLLGQCHHGFFVLLFTTDLVLTGWLVGDDKQVLRVEIKVLIQDTTAAFLLYALFPLGVDLKDNRYKHRLKVKKMKAKMKN